MSDIIQNLINSVLEDGARPSKYRAMILFPTSMVDYQTELDVMCKSTEIPTKTNEVIFLKHKGRNIPIPGQERFGHTLNLTFYLDSKHKYKSLFEEWMQGLNYDNYASDNDLSDTTINVKDSQFGDTPSIVKSKIKLVQLNFDGDLEEVEYEFFNVFPKEISQVNLGSESVSAISEFSVAFVYSHYKINKIANGTNSNDIANDILNKVQDTANKIVDSALGYIPSSITGNTNKYADKSAKAIQNAGKTIGSTINEFLG